jgi:hypothetical protein
MKTVFAMQVGYGGIIKTGGIDRRKYGFAKTDQKM